ncbi:MAG: DUF1080 domain-containing protein [Chitinophagaceae bacterium]|nr:MAG: DUF1080 domain-containing protein [Chitinophagaceae bacterium]
MKINWTIGKLSLFLIFSVAALSCISAENSIKNKKLRKGWISLFNGKNLSGWTELEGKTKFEAKDGQIIATTYPNNVNSMLCTNQSYENFILEADVKVDSPLNSGIQVRSHLNEKGEVYGLQIEVDPSSRAWSGRVYDCRRRNWAITPMEKLGNQNAFKNGKWNHYRIRYAGDTLESWINGIHIATFVDTLPEPHGFIALQVDGQRQGELRVRFKNIRIKLLK